MNNREFKPQNSLGYLIRQTGRAIRNKVQCNIKQTGIETTMEQVGILMMLWNKNGISQQELVERLDKDKTTIARTINAMENSLLVVKIENKTDKRKNNIYLTKKGKEIREELKKAILKTLNEATKGISDNELEIFKSTLQKIYNNIGNNNQQNDTCN